MRPRSNASVPLYVGQPLSKLSPAREAELLAELELASLFTEKMWMRRYGVSARTLGRLKAKVRRRPVAEIQPDTLHVVLSANGPAKKSEAA